MSLNDEMYDVIDIDEAIAQKQELIARAKELTEDGATGDLLKACTRLRRKWRRIPYWESAYEDQLAQEFDDYISVVYSRRHLVMENNLQAKKALIAEVQALEASKPVRAMDETMERWKQIGSAGREADEELWHEFTTARRSFFERKRAYWNEMKDHYEEAKETKKKLIEDAKAIVANADYYHDGKRFEELLTEWKAAGFTGDRATEDALWEEFSTVRRQYHKDRSAFFGEIHAKRKEAYAIKKQLLVDARAILDSGETTRETTQSMRDISQKWKEAGSCGRDREDRLWKEYREIMDAYYGRLRGDQEARQARQQEYLANRKANIQTQIASQKRQIERLRQEAAETLSEAMANEIAEEIADKEDYIAELEEDLANLDN